MAKSKTSSPSFIAHRNAERSAITQSHPYLVGVRGRLRFPRNSCEEHFPLIEPQISVEGIHIWNFNLGCPLDVLFLTESGQHNIRMNRHNYFEVLYLCSGSALCHVQDRLLPMQVGDLAVIGSTVYHRIERRSSQPLTLAALFFDPEMIRCDGGNDSIQYLTPFLFQDAKFPHIITAETGIPRQVLEMMLRIHAERASFSNARLVLKTYLKMILVRLVTHYASYSGKANLVYRRNKVLERVRPLFQYLQENCSSTIQIRQAARVCGMSESHFMNVFKEATGLSFLKYLIHYRVERARIKLVYTDESVKNICQDVGFCDQSYFGAVFRKIVGVTPAKYRRRFRNSTGECPDAHQEFSPLSANMRLLGCSDHTDSALRRKEVFGEWSRQ